MAFWKNGKLMMIEGSVKYKIFLDNFCLKQPLVLKIPVGMFFEPTNSEMASELPKNLLLLSYRQILSKFAMRYISVKKTMWCYSWLNCFSIALLNSSSFLVHLVLKSDNFSELILLNYCCLIIQYMEFFFEKTLIDYT